MAFRVGFLHRAEVEVNAIVDWLIQRSPQGAARWLAALDQAKTLLEENPHGYGLAPENEFVEREIRHILFKTRRGRKYRALFTIEDDEVRILHVRGPGQANMTSRDLQE